MDRWYLSGNQELDSGMNVCEMAIAYYKTDSIEATEKYSKYLMGGIRTYMSVNEELQNIETMEAFHEKYLEQDDEMTFEIEDLNLTENEKYWLEIEKEGKTYINLDRKFDMRSTFRRIRNKHIKDEQIFDHTFGVHIMNETDKVKITTRMRESAKKMKVNNVKILENITKINSQQDSGNLDKKRQFVKDIVLSFFQLIDDRNDTLVVDEDDQDYYDDSITIKDTAMLRNMIGDTDLAIEVNSMFEVGNINNECTVLFGLLNKIGRAHV